jgi:DNA polymerase III subunit epsilon
MRRIILDLETTGLDPRKGHKIVEIGCIEVINRVRTEKIFHLYIDPEREMPEQAFRVHGISAQFLRGKPKFHEIAQGFLDFIGEDSKLIAHNASFDIGFLNHQLGDLGHPSIDKSRVIDTLYLARKNFPGSPASLDALCKRFNISLADREKKGHGALLDSELLYEVYIMLTEGIQSELIVASKKVNEHLEEARLHRSKPPVEPRRFLYKKDNKEHEEFLKKIKNSAWTKSKSN